MSRLESIPGRMMDLVDHVGGSIRDHMPSRAGTLLQTGAALGMARTGTHVAGHFLRRHPGAILAAVAGAGVAWYVVHRYRKKQQAGLSIDGQSRRVESQQQTRKRRSASDTGSSNTGSSNTAGSSNVGNSRARETAVGGMDARPED